MFCSSKGNNDTIKPYSYHTIIEQLDGISFLKILYFESIKNWCVNRCV